VSHFAKEKAVKWSDHWCRPKYWWI